MYVKYTPYQKEIISHHPFLVPSREIGIGDGTTMIT